MWQWNMSNQGNFFCMGHFLSEDVDLNVSLELCYGPVQPLVFLFKSFYTYEHLLSNGLRYAIQACSLNILISYSSLKAAIAICDPKALLPKHLYLPDVSVWSSERWFSTLQILPFWEGFEWVADSTKSFSVFFFLSVLVLHSWLFLQTRFMLLILGNYSKYFHKLQGSVCFSCVCIFLLC